MKDRQPPFIVETQPELSKKIGRRPLHIDRIKKALADELHEKRTAVKKRGELLHSQKDLTKQREILLQRLEQLAERINEIEGGNKMLLQEIEAVREEKDSLDHELTQTDLELSRQTRDWRDAVATVRRVAIERLSYHTEKILQSWEQLEFSTDDVRRFFSEEFLSRLDVDAYAKLMRRFPSEMITHVTRQGVRDHAGGAFHTTGLNTFSDGFVNILRARRLHSLLGKCTTQEMKEGAVVAYLTQEDCKTKEEALSWIRSMTNAESQGTPGVYSDDTAIHVATEHVADNLYGAEHGNEIFFAFPSIFIAANYAYSGNLTKSDESYWNDQWIWTQEHRGIPIDAGIVFIPAATRVDPTTGSRYALDKNKKSIRATDGALTLAPDTVSSREYWESFFKTHPALRPSKIVYYEGDDPTAALNTWRDSHGIEKRTADGRLPIENRADRNSPIALHGADRFRSIAAEVIEKHFK